MYKVFYKKKIFLLFNLFFSAIVLIAQPANDECDSPILINNATDFCSGTAAYTNVGATPTDFTNNTGCASDGGNDVWFSFLAVNTDATITVIGNAFGQSGGTLNRPEVELLLVDNCNVFQSIQCEVGNSSNIVELNKSGLLPGATYYIRVLGEGTRTGTFELCVQNFARPATPGSDAEDASVLCDKSAFTIEQLTSCGNDCDEGTGTCLEGEPDIFGNFAPSESNSAWFTWIAGTQGLLTMTIAPLNPVDDIDFAIFELPNGVNNGDGKVALRCMASSCFGPTGLRDSSEDFIEVAGCEGESDNFLAPLFLEEGKAYGILINNFSETGNGVSIEFGGSTEFEGPVPDLNVTANGTGNACFGESFTFSDNSSFAVGQITSREWFFGVGASPETATGPGPHEVTYSSPGEKTVALVLETNLGCRTTKVFESVITVNPCCESLNEINLQSNITEIDCPTDGNGAIDLTLSSNSTIVSTEWSNDAMTEDLNDLAPGTYEVVVTNAATCTATFSHTFDAPDSIKAVETTVNPSCGGGMDGSITIDVTGGRPPYQYNFGDGNFVDNNIQAGLSIGDYEVIVRDASGCTALVEAIELDEKELEINIENTTDPQCSEENTGSVEINISNGTAPYQYDFNNGNGLAGGDEVLNAIEAGNYIIDVFDAEQCRGTFEFSLMDPEPLNLIVEAGRVTCAGDNDGSAIAIASGGTGNYTYNWSNGGITQSIDNLAVGDYTVIISDENNCTIERVVNISEPPALEASIVDMQDLLCPDEDNGTVEIEAIGGTPPYEYSVDGLTFQSTPNLTGLSAGDYTLVIKDDMGCTIELSATINSPESLAITVDAPAGICYGETVTYTDASSFSRGEIVNWEWNFGEGASPAIGSGAGPHTVTYTTIGTPMVELKLTTDLGCEVIYSEAANFAITPCCETINSINLTALPTDALCAGSEDGAIDLEITSAPPLTTIEWNNGVTTEDLNSLPAGDYSVIVTNDATCERAATYTISEPNEITLTSTITDPSCGGAADGTIELSAIGGSGGFEYDFGNGFVTTHIASNLPNGQYAVIVQDQNNCTASLDVELQELELMPAEPTITQPSCFGLEDGSIQLTIANGTAPFEYDFNDGNGFVAADSLNGLAAGIYDLQIRDANQCLGAIQITVDQPGELAIAINPIDVSCFGAGDGRIETQVTGGVGNYIYSWSDGQIGSLAIGLEPGDYTVNVADGNGCSIDDNASIMEPEALEAMLESVQDVLCFGETNGAITVGVNGGTFPYSYSLDGVLFQSFSTLGDLTAGGYTVIVRDDRGCEAEVAANIEEPGEFSVSISADKEVADLGFPVNLHANANIGNGGIIFQWSPLDSTLNCNNCSSIEVTPPGSTTYTVLAINSDNCTATASLDIAVTLNRPIFIPNAFSPNGDGNNDKFFIHTTPAVRKISKLLVFDRFGSLVYEAFNILPGDQLTGWDGSYNGTQLRYGVFVVVAEVEFIDGETILYETDVTLFGED